MLTVKFPEFLSAPKCNTRMRMNAFRLLLPKLRLPGNSSSCLSTTSKVIKQLFMLRFLVYMLHSRVATMARVTSVNPSERRGDLFLSLREIAA